MTDVLKKPTKPLTLEELVKAKKENAEKKPTVSFSVTAEQKKSIEAKAEALDISAADLMRVLLEKEGIIES